MEIGVNYSQAPKRDMNFWEQYQLAEILAQFPALTVMVLIRRRVGLRRARPAPLLIMAALLMGVGYYFQSDWLMVFALAEAIVGYWQHWNRWRELRAGAVWHTFSNGISYFEFLLPRFLHRLRLPPFLQRWGVERFTLDWWAADCRIYRYLDPIAVYLVGLLVFIGLDRALGLWLAFAGACLSVHEKQIYRENLVRYLDWYDSQIDAMTMKGWKGDRAGKRKVDSPRLIKDSYGIPTGVGEDIRLKIEERAREMKELQKADRKEALPEAPASNAPDNLA